MKQEEENIQNISSDNIDEFEDVTFVESTEDGDVLPTKDIVKKLRDELKKIRAEKDEYLTGWQRAKADYVNIQKELNEIRINTANITKEKVVVDLLPVLDSFDMAFSNKEAWEKVDANWRTGIEYIYQQFTKKLEDLNVFKINEIGVDFDPNMHEPIDTLDTKEKDQDHKIASIVQPGYKVHDSQNQIKVIRPAKVRVYKAS